MAPRQRSCRRRSINNLAATTQVNATRALRGKKRTRSSPQVGFELHFDHSVPATIVMQEPHVDGVLGNRAVSFQMPLTRSSWLHPSVLDASIPTKQSMRPFAAGDHKAGFVGQDDCLGPLGEMKLGKDMSHVRLDRAHTDNQMGSDVGARQALSEQAKDFELTLGQRAQRLGRP